MNGKASKLVKDLYIQLMCGPNGKLKEGIQQYVDFRSTKGKQCTHPINHYRSMKRIYTSEGKGLAGLEAAGQYAMSFQ